MKLPLAILLGALTAASSLVPKSATQLQSDLPSPRFTTELFFDAPLLPVNPTLAGITYFMSKVARRDFDAALQPQSYTSPEYPEVKVSSHSSIKARFLLWGIYLAAIDMVRYSRFNEVVINLYWDGQIMGQVSILAETSQSLSIAELNSTGSVVTDGGELSLNNNGSSSTQAMVEGLNIPKVENVTRSTATLRNRSDVSSMRAWTTVSGNRASSPTQLSPNPSPSGRSFIEFDRVPGASKLKRNDVFLSFYVAMLHLAKLPAGDHLLYFSSQSPTVNVRVHMYDIGAGCSNGQAVKALAFVPMYMMEHPGFGYKETNFNVMLRGVKACRGSVLDDNLLSAD